MNLVVQNDIAIWVLLGICVILLGLLVWIVGYIAWIFAAIAVHAVRERRRPTLHYPPQETPLGAMTFDQNSWSTERNLDGHQLNISLDDAGGQPDPHAIAFLIDHWDQLSELQATARRGIDYLTDEHEFYGVSSYPEGDICLHFCLEQEAWGETVFVDMSDGRVAGWTVAD